jgi:hypothetical protein
MPLPETTTTRKPRLPDDRDILDRLEKAVRQGDWNAVSRFTHQAATEQVPVTPDALAERLRRLERILVAARVGRAGLAISLGRARAAASFTHSRLVQRQEYGDSPEF